MSYSYASAPERTSAASYSRIAAAALLAVSAGACVGVAVAPAVSSLYARTAVRSVVSQVVVTPASTGFQAMDAPSFVEGPTAGPVRVSQAESSFVSGWTLLSGGLFASAAALMAFALKGSRSESAEQIAMLATFGKKTVKTSGKTASKAAPKADRPLWYPTAVAPEWLDGSLPGDRGFDPWGLSKPTEYLQFDLDGLDQNAPKNTIGKVVGVVKAEADQVSTDSLQPYSEVFGLQRFRECELIHGRWAMLAVVGCLVSEAVTGVAWQNAGLVEATQGSTYWGNPLPFTGSQVVWFEVLSMGFVEVFRNTELNLEKRCYPGGAFDPLGLTKKDEETTFRLKEAELKHGRLAMVAFLGFAAAAANTGAGATEAFSKWASNFS